MVRDSILKQTPIQTRQSRRKEQTKQQRENNKLKHYRSDCTLRYDALYRDQNEIIHSTEVF